MTAERLIVYACLIGLAYTFVSDNPERKAILTREEAEAAQIVELRDQVNQLAQQIKVTAAKLERAPQSCGTGEWLKYDGRRM